LSLPANHCANYQDQHDAPSHNSNHDGELIIAGRAIDITVACVCLTILDVTVYALKRVSSPLCKVKSTRSIIRAFDALCFTLFAGEGVQRTRFLYFTVSASETSFTKLAFVSPAITELRSFANIPEITAFSTLNDALGLTGPANRQNGILASLFDHFG
jgi:hypothetical protein